MATTHTHLDPYNRPSTTFRMDFMIASRFGKNAVLDTYRRVKRDWLENVPYFTEAVMEINALAWFFYGKDDEMCALFSDLYYTARDAFYDEYTGDEEACSYFFEVTD